MGLTEIGWCTHSWNAIRWWCSIVSPGCKNCYMMAMAARRENRKFAADHAVWRDEAWNELRLFPSFAEVFVLDMGDLFHKDMPLEYQKRHWQAFTARPDITFLLLTKRPENALRLTLEGAITWLPNLWLGTSVESATFRHRMDTIRQIPVHADQRFASVEPLLASVGELNLQGFRQIITGGESGEHRREFKAAWAIEVRDQCSAAGVSFYHKQGSQWKPGQDRLLEGREHNDLAWRVPPPVDEQVSLF